MNFLKELFSATPEKVDKVAWSSLPEDEKLAKLLKFTEHQEPKVRIQAVRRLHPGKQNDHYNSEEIILGRLSGMVLSESDLEVKTEACNKIIELLRGSEVFGFVAGKYPEAVEAITMQLNSTKEAADSAISQLRTGPPKFHQMFRFGLNSGKLISALGQYAGNKQNSNENRNWATIILGRLKDIRTIDFLQKIANSSDVYLKTNARQSLQQIEPEDGLLSFSIDGWKIERFSGSKMEKFAQSAGISGENNLRLIYAFNLIPEIGIRGKWSAYGSWPCPNCGGSISFGLDNLFNAEESTVKGSCYPRQDYSVVIKYRKTEKENSINIPVLIFTNSTAQLQDSLLYFTYFQKY